MEKKFIKNNIFNTNKLILIILKKWKQFYKRFPKDSYFYRKRKIQNLPIIVVNQKKIMIK